MSSIFQTFTQKNVTLPNRIVMSPMCMYSAGEDGKVTDFHRVHYGTRSLGKVGLIMIEATAVESRGRISSRDLGLWNDGQKEGLKEIVDFAHSQGVKTAIQLAHAGRKAEVDEPIIAPSAIAFDDKSKTPNEMTTEDIKTVVQSFADAARRAKEIGFDIVEIHAAHGYLINEFLSPLSNQRTDEYGGDLDGRSRFLKEVIQAVQETWGTDRPLYVRISAVDHHPDGIQIEDSIALARKLKEWGVDLIDVSSGEPCPWHPTKSIRVIRFLMLKRSKKKPALPPVPSALSPHRNKRKIFWEMNGPIWSSWDANCSAIPSGCWMPQETVMFPISAPNNTGWLINKKRRGPIPSFFFGE